MKKQMTKITLAVTFEIPTKWVPPGLREKLAHGPITQEEFLECPEDDDGGLYASLDMQLCPTESRHDEVMKYLVDSLNHLIIEAVRDHLCTDGYLGFKYAPIESAKEKGALTNPSEEQEEAHQ